MLKIGAIGTDNTAEACIWRYVRAGYAHPSLSLEHQERNRGMVKKQSTVGRDTDEPTAGRSARLSVFPYASTLPGDSPLLAQIPDLDAADSDDPEDEALGGSDGRLVSQALSSKLVIGGGFVLVLAAILPLVLNRKASPKPTPSQPPAATGAAETAPAWQGGVIPPAGMQTGPLLTPTPSTAAGFEPAGPGGAPPRAYLQPQPRVGTNRPMAIGEPPWTPPAGADAHRAQNNRPDYIQDSGAAAPENFQADRRNEVGADYRNDNRGDYRNENRGDYRTGYPGAGAPQGNPLMPSPEAAAAPPSQDSPPQPGVARFEGTIAAPPLRNATTYDRAGPSIH
jgi:hypothetical protein